VLLKAMIVHGACWGDAYSILRAVLQTSANQRRFREEVARFLGYGLVQPDRLFGCEDHRATLLGCGALEKEQAHLYSVPLPPSLAGVRVWRRLTITLAWLTPVNSRSRAYRCASLWFEPPTEELGIDRREVHSYATQRGTVQHEILEGERATSFVDGDTLKIIVNCRAVAEPLSEPVPYAIAVSVEIAEGLQIPVYEEIRTRIRPPVYVAP
ncbi:hypothetical protein ACFLXA_04525, partial [Chloroflexota bacterium]